MESADKTSNSNEKSVTTRSQLVAERKNLTLDSLADLLLEMENRMTTSLNKATTSTTDKLAKVSKSISSLEKSHSEKFDSLERKLSDHETSVNKALTEFQDMKKDVAALREELNGLKAANLSPAPSAELLEVREQLEDLRQYTRNRNLIIDGVPPTVGENLATIFFHMGKGLGMKIDPNEIEAIHRLPTRNTTTNRPPSIIVQVKSRPLRDNFVKAAIKKKFKLSDLGIASTGNVYVSEHLTSHRAKLYYEARMLRKNHNYKYVWIRGGKVFLKKDDSPESRTIEVRNIDVINQLRS